MKTPLLLASAAVAMIVACASGALPPRAEADAAETALVARGAYLTGPAGQCADCHGQGLHGGHKVPAPNLAGLKMFANDADALKFLETALTPEGKRVPIMPPFQFNSADAHAIVAYLRQLR